MDDQIQTAAETQSVAQVATKTKMPFKKKLLIAALLVAGVFALLVIFANQATQGAVTASNKFVNAMQAKDSGQAYGLFSSAAKETVTSEEFDVMVQQIAPILNTEEKMKDKSVTTETGKDTTGKVVYEIKGTDGKTYTLTVNLVKQDDNWQVQNFESDAK